jgi:hypothetical protein
LQDATERRIISGKKNSFHASKTECKERIERGKGGGLHLLFFTCFGD